MRNPAVCWKTSTASKELSPNGNSWSGRTHAIRCACLGRSPSSLNRSHPWAGTPSHLPTLLGLPVSLRHCVASSPRTLHLLELPRSHSVEQLIQLHSHNLLLARGPNPGHRLLPPPRPAFPAAPAPRAPLRGHHALPSALLHWSPLQAVARMRIRLRKPRTSSP